MGAIFISHSSTDNSTAAEFKRQLELQGHRSLFLDFDPDLGIPPGRDWEQELYRQLRTCQAVIVLCSENSMSSDWCFAEITHAKSLGKHVFPVKVGPCKVKAVLTSQQIIDLTRNPEMAYQSLWRGLKVAGLDPADSFDWDCSRSPYPGMMAFEEKDAAVFCGREQEIQQGLETLKRLQQFGGARMLLVLGASGSGKSSLVRAGFLPRLRRNPDLWLIVDPFRPQDDPLRELAIALADAFGLSDQKRTWKEICEQLEQAAGAEKSREKVFLNDVALDLKIARKQREATTLLIIDQAEELLVRSEEEKAASFLSLLRCALEAPNTPLVAIFTLRSDFLGEFQRQPDLLGLSREHIPVGPMAAEHLTKIIEEPARIAGIELEAGLTPAMVRDTKSQDALPLFAFTLRELYDDYGDDKLLEVNEYREKLGGLNGAVALAADKALAAAQLSSNEEEDLRSALVSLARINEEGQFTRLPARWSDLPESVHGVLERFVQARLLIARQEEGKERMLEVAHEALFHSWGRLKGWLDEDREFLLWRKRFREAQQEWFRTGHDPGALLNGPALTEAQGWLERRAKQFAPKEREYLEKSTCLAKRRKNKRLWALVSTIVFLIAIALGGVVLWQRAEKQAAIAKHAEEKAKEQAGIAKHAEENAKEQADIAQKAKIEAEQQAELARRGTYNVQLARARNLWQREPIQATALLNDTDLAPLELRDFAWRFLYRLSNKTQMTLSGHTEMVFCLVFSPDGQILASASQDKTIKLWDAKTGQERATLTGHTLAVSSVAFSPDGQILASASGDQTIKLWDAKTGQECATLIGHTLAVSSVAFSPDGQILASATGDQTIKLWDSKTGQERATLTGHTLAVSSVAFSPDGQTLASASKD